MKVHLETVDSFVWGKNVLSLSELSVDDDIQQVEKDYLEKYDPVYVSVRLPMESLSIISNFEQNGVLLDRMSVASSCSVVKGI